ncbi:hypothetical protein [Micromonospora zamorensis]|uniref:hypothetical protein n=1 Tax=Micromonospora zamorensis TaxID=709883 RepID=UPI0037A50B59
MPRMNGREVLAVVKADEVLKAIPVVVFTTSAVDADVLGSYSAHANAYVTKPIDLDAFERASARSTSSTARSPRCRCPGRRESGAAATRRRGPADSHLTHRQR